MKLGIYRGLAMALISHSSASFFSAPCNDHSLKQDVFSSATRSKGEKARNKKYRNSK